MKFILAIFLLSSTLLLSQGRVWQPKSFDSLDVNPDIRLNDEERVQYSKGYFPTPVYNSFTVGILNENTVLFSKANGINPNGLKNINGGYSIHYEEDISHRKFKKKFSDEEEDEHIKTESYSWGLDFRLTPDIGIPVIFRAAAMVTWSTDILFSMDYSKSYLDYDNTMNSYFEINNLLLEETLFDTKLGVSIPIYGAFVNQQAAYSSIFSLYIGVSNAQVIHSKATQFVQIGNAKNKIRFENGLDTLVQTSNLELPTLISNRFGIEVGIEHSSVIAGIGYNVWVNAQIPMQSILSDENWRQYQLRFGAVLYIGGLFRLL